MTGEYNPNLQQAPDSSKQTIEDNTRYEWAEDFNRLRVLGNRAGDMYTEQMKARNKAQQTALETAFDKEVAQAISVYERTPNAPRSELDANMNALIEKYPTLTMSTKTAIMGNRNYRSPLVSAVEASDIATKEQAKKTAVRNQEYMDLASSYWGAEKIANLSDEAKIEEGKRLYAEQTLTKDIGGLLNTQLSLKTKQNLSGVAAQYIQDAIGQDIANNIDNFGPEWFGTYKVNITKALIADGVPREFANIIVQRASEPYEPLAKGITQSREDLLKSVQQQNSTVENLFTLRENVATGLSAASRKDLAQMYPYLGEKEREYTKYIPLNIASTGMQNLKMKDELQRNGILFANDPQTVFNMMHSLYYNQPLATTNQKMNGTLAGLDAMSDSIENTPQEERERNGAEWAKANSYNLRVLYNQLVDNAPVITEAFKQNADPKQKENMIKTFKRNFKTAIDNELIKLYSETKGTLHYEDGYFWSDDEADDEVIEETNNLLAAIENIDESLGGEALSAEEIDTQIMKGMADWSLFVPNSKNLLEEIEEAPVKPIGWLGRWLGDEDTEFISLTPRQAMVKQNAKRQIQKNSVEALRKSSANQYYGENTYVPPREAQSFWKRTWEKYKEAREQIPVPFRSPLLYAPDAPKQVYTAIPRAAKAIEERNQRLREQAQELEDRYLENTEELNEDLQDLIEEKIKQELNKQKKQQRDLNTV